MKNFFELFGFTPAYALDVEKLDSAYREIQARIHPDKFAHAGDAERRASMQWTTRVNEAYRTLKSPLLRARYLLELNGVDAALETNTAMPREFLMKQMELRERLEAAQDAKSLAQLQEQFLKEKQHLQARIAEVIDIQHDFAGAAELVRKLMFLERFGEDIDAAYESLGQ